MTRSINPRPQQSARWARSMLLGLATVVLRAHAQSSAEPPPNLETLNNLHTSLVTEELLYLVMRHCRAGQSAQAQRLAQDISQQFATTPAIEALLNPVLSGACEPTAPDHQHELHLSVGWDDNINLGTPISSITLQSRTQTITYQLDDSNKPIGSTYLSASATHQTTTANGWTVQTMAATRQLTHSSPYSTLGLQVTLSRNARAWSTPGHLTLGRAETWLSGQHHRSATSIAWQNLPTRGQGGWVLAASVQQNSYADSSLNNLQLQASATHHSDLNQHNPQRQRSARTQISWGVGLLHDQALRTRAGGNRHGLYLQAGWQHTHAAGTWHAQWALHQWTSTQPFLPGLFNQRRSNQTTTWVTGYQRPLNPRALIYIEYQHRNSRDNVPLYSYRSNQLGAGWLLRWP